MEALQRRKRNCRPAATTSAEVERFVRRMRVVGQGDARLLVWLKELGPEATCMSGPDCAQHVFAYRQALRSPEEGCQDPSTTTALPTPPRRLATFPGPGLVG